MDARHLVLSRRCGESVEFTTATGEVILVTLDRMTGSRASISIHAPDTVRILRRELMDEMYRTHGEPVA